MARALFFIVASVACKDSVGVLTMRSRAQEQATATVQTFVYLAWRYF